MFIVKHSGLPVYDKFGPKWIFKPSHLGSTFWALNIHVDSMFDYWNPEKYLSWVLAYLLLGCGRYCMLVWRLWRFLQWSTVDLWSWGWTAERSVSNNLQGSKSDANKRNYSQDCDSWNSKKQNTPKTIRIIPTWGIFEDVWFPPLYAWLQMAAPCPERERWSSGPATEVV